MKKSVALSPILAAPPQSYCVIVIQILRDLYGNGNIAMALVELHSLEAKQNI
jgi:hypothetical protein